MYSRGRGRGRWRGETGKPQREKQPGLTTDEIENWDTGVPTEYSVTSVTYSDSQNFSDRPKDLDLSDRTNSGGVEKPLPRTTAPVGRCLDDSDDSSGSGDIDDWEFGDRPSTKAHVASSSEPQELNDEALAAANPGVSVDWLRSLMARVQVKPDAAVAKRTKEASLADSFTSLSVDERQTASDWLQKLEKCWVTKAKAEVSRQVSRCFNSVNNPYTTALYLIESAFDYTGKKTSTLSRHFACEFSKWAKQHTHKQQLLDAGGPPLKTYAFCVATRFHMTSFDHIISAFQLCHAGNEYLVPYVRAFVAQERLTEATTAISKLNLHQYFNTEEIVLPLILQDKINLVQAYVFRHEDQQKELLKVLDKLCDENISLFHYAQDSGVKDVQYDKFNRKTLGKLANRLMKLYKVPREICPNIDRRQRQSSMRYLFYLFYGEQSVSRASWREQLSTAVGSDSLLHEWLIDALLNAYDNEEAVWWAHKLNMKPDVLPGHIVEALKHMPREADEDMTTGADGGEEEEDWDAEHLQQSSCHYRFELQRSDVRLIDNQKAFVDAVTEIVATPKIIGIDAEWKPSFGQEAAIRIALLQIATSKQVFLFDIIRLNQKLTTENWTWFGRNIFCNERLTKVGYGLDGDLQMLASSVPVLKEFLLELRRFVELQDVHKHVKQFPDVYKCAQMEETVAPETLRGPRSDERGLSELVRHCFGRPLDKSEQLSDWERRPLRLAQMLYAAVDAHVLVTLYQHIVENAARAGLSAGTEPVNTSPASSRQRLTKRERMQAYVAEQKQQK